MKKIIIFSVVVVGIFISPLFTFARTIYLDGGGTVDGTSTISWSSASNVWIAGDASGPGNSIQSSTISISASSTIWATFLQPTIATSTFGDLLSLAPDNFTMQANAQFWTDCYRGTGNVVSSTYDATYTAWSVEMVQQGSAVCINTGTLAIGSRVGFVGLYAFASGGLDGLLQDVAIHNNNFGTNSISGLQLWFQVADSPYGGSITPSIGINWIFPVNATTTVPFLNMSAQLTGLSSSSLYAVQEVSNVNGRLIPGLQQQNTGAYFTRFGYTTPFPIINDNGFGSNISVISKIFVYDITQNGFLPIVQLPDTSSTIQWSLIPYINNGLNEVNGTTTILANDPIYIQATSTTPVVTPWDGQVSMATTTNPIQATTSTFNCIPPSNSADLGGGAAYGICYGWNFISSKAQQAGTDVVNFIWLRMEGIFPFSVPVTTYNAIQENASTTLSTTTMPVIQIVMPYTLWQTSTTSRTLVIWDSSWDPFAAAPGLKDMWFQLQSLLLTFGFIVLVYTTVRHE